MDGRDDRYTHIRKFLQEYHPQPVSISAISRALGMNRGSVSKYLEVMQSHGQVIMKPFGRAKLYSLSQNIPLDDLFDNLSDAIVILNADLRILMVNRSFIKTFRIRGEKNIIIGSDLSRLSLPLLNDTTVQNNIGRIIQSETFVNEMLLIEHNTERIFLTEFISTVIPSGSFSGEPGIMISLRDITTWKKTEDDLRTSERQIRTLFEEVPSGIFLFSEDGTILNANRAALAILGLTGFTDLNDVKLFDLICTRQAIEDLIEAGTIAELTIPCNFDRLKTGILSSTKKSGIAYLQVVFAPVVKNTGSAPREFFILFLDITAKRRAEKELKERYQGITCNLPGIAYQFYAKKTGEWGVYYVDDRSMEIYGIPLAPLETWFQRFGACIAPEDRSRWFESIMEVVERVAPWDFEGRFIRPTGEEMFIRGVSQPVMLKNETVWNGIFLNITDRKRAEQALQTSVFQETRYRSFFEDTCNGVLIYEPIEGGNEYIIKDVNRATATLLRMEKQDLIGKRLFEEFPDLPDPSVREMLIRVLTTEKPEFLLPLKYRNREDFPWISHYVFKLPSGEIASFMVDVSDAVRQGTDPKGLLNGELFSQSLVPIRP
jgi:PAS domain S-box-containing protein